LVKSSTIGPCSGRRKHRRGEGDAELGPMVEDFTNSMEVVRVATPSKLKKQLKASLYTKQKQQSKETNIKYSNHLS
jgi:hypothetical protein